MTWWHGITFLGDSAFTVPGACALALWLAVNGLWLQMLRWLLAFGAAMGVVVITKLLFMGWNITPPLLYNFTGASGHSASASALYLTAAVLLSEGQQARVRALAIASAGALALLVGFSRLAIKVHSLSEVGTGLMLGALAAWWFCRGLERPQRVLHGRFVLAAAALFMLMGTSGQPAPTHAFLQQLALSLSGHDKVYTRTIAL